MTLAESSPAPAATSKRALRRIGRTPTPVIFAICIILAGALLWWQGSIREIVHAIGDADVRWLLVAAPIYVASVGLLCIRWHLLVRMAQGWSDLPRASEAFLTSVVINYAAPVGLAVPSRAALTKRALGLDPGATGSIALWEIGADVLILGAGSVLWLGLAEGSTAAVGRELSNSASQYAKWGAVGFGLVALLLIWILRTPAQRRRFVRLAHRILVSPKQRPAEAALSLAVTLVYWIVQGIVLAILVHAMHVESSFVFVLGLTSVPILVGMLSPIPGGAVVREALMYVVARLAGVATGPVVAAAVIYRIALFGAIPILYLLVRWWIRHHPHGHPNLPTHEDAA